MLEPHCSLSAHECPQVFLSDVQNSEDIGPPSYFISNLGFILACIAIGIIFCGYGLSTWLYFIEQDTASNELYFNEIPFMKIKLAKEV